MDDVREQNLRAWLTLHLAPGMGPITAHRLVDAAGGVREALSASDTVLEAIGVARAARQALRDPSSAELERCLEWAAHPNHTLLCPDDADYPPLLMELPDAPAILYVIGKVELARLPQLAVVGARSASAAGVQTATSFATALARAGLVITSGLALGIDSAAHRAALAAGCPTVAVLGTGADQVYPARHIDLAHEIAASGALLSEFPLGTGPRGHQFPRRNRLISGLSTGVLVVEAAARSGSLGTARCALEQGREVFAVPGSINNPLARGCHALIREGATLVETTEHIIEQLGALLGHVFADDYEQPPVATHSESNSLTGQQKLVLESFRYEPCAVDTLVSRSGLTAQEVSSILLILELNGLVAAQAGGVFNRL